MSGTVQDALSYQSGEASQFAMTREQALALAAEVRRLCGTETVAS